MDLLNLPRDGLIPTSETISRLGTALSYILRLIYWCWLLHMLAKGRSPHALVTTAADAAALYAVQYCRPGKVGADRPLIE
jgi:hypothetical protein